MDVSEQINQFYEFIETEYYEDLVRQVSKGNKFLEIDFNKLTKFNPELAELLLEKPEETIKAAELSIDSFDMEGDTKNFKVRIINLSKTADKDIWKIRAKEIDELITIKGYIRTISDVQHAISSARFECPSCFPKGTLIQTTKGCVPIEEAEEVICLDYRLKPTVRLAEIIPTGEKTVWQIEGLIRDKKHSVCCSGEHKWFIYKNGVTSVVQTKDLNKGDIIYRINYDKMHNMPKNSSNTLLLSFWKKNKIHKENLFTKMQKKILQQLPNWCRKNKAGQSKNNTDVHQRKEIINRNSETARNNPQINTKEITEIKNTSTKYERTMQNQFTQLKGLQAWEEMWGKILQTNNAQELPYEMQSLWENTRRVREIAFNPPHKRESYRQQNRESDDPVPIMPFEITLVEKTKKKTEMYDLKVPDYNNFILSNGLVTHNCGNIITILMVDAEFKKPSKCTCGRKGKFRLLHRELVDVQKVIVEEDPATLKPAQKPRSILVTLKEDLCRSGIDETLQPSRKVLVTGIIKDEQKLPNLVLCKKYVSANNITVLDASIEKMGFTQKEIGMFKRISKSKSLYEDLGQSIIPNIQGHKTVRTAIVLQLIGGVPLYIDDQLEERGVIHIILIGSPGCYAPETLLTLSDGTFIRGNKLYSKCTNDKLRIGRIHSTDAPNAKITNHFHYAAIPTKKINTTSKELTCSYEHPLLVKSKNSREWIKAKDLKEGDKIRVCNKINCTKKNYEMVGNLVCDEELGLFWGYAIADGSVRKYELSLYFNEEEGVQKKIEEILKKKSIKYSLSKRKPITGHIGKRLIKRKQTIQRIHIYSKYLAHIFRMKKQPQRIIPDTILASKKSVVASFLSGLFEGDGSISSLIRRNRRATPRIALKSSSHQLLLDTQVLLLKFGIESRIYSNNLTISKVKDVILFRDEINFVSLKKRNRMKAYLKKVAKQKRFQRHKLYEKIVKIEEGKRQSVYDVEIKKYHRLLTNGIMSHNSGKSVMLKRAKEFLPGGRFTGGRGATGIGLVAAVTKDEEMGGWVLSAGAVPMASGSICCIDEIDKMNKTDIAFMNNAMVDMCYDKDTEILTKDGWKKFENLLGAEEVATLSKKGNLEYHRIKRKYEFKYKGKMLALKNQQVNLLVSPEHNLYVSTKKWANEWKEYGLLRAIDVHNKHLKFKKDCDWKGVKKDRFILPQVKKKKNQFGTGFLTRRKYLDMDAWLGFLGWYVSEGSLKEIKGVPYHVYITQQNKANRLLIEENLKKLKFKYSKQGINFCICNKQLATYLKKEAGKGAANKKTPMFIKELTIEKINKFLKTLILGGDGWKTGYCSSSKRLIDDVQELLLKTGGGGNIRRVKVNKRNGMIKGRKIKSFLPHFTINFNTKLKPELNSHHPQYKFINYSGKIYCVKVKNHVIYVRRKGVGVWCGNCVNIDKATVHGKLETETMILAAANPKDRVFDSREVVWKQIGLPKDFLDRFDLVFPVKLSRNESEQRKVANMVVGKYRESSKAAKPIYSHSLVTKYIAYARKNYSPVMNKPVQEYIVNNFINIVIPSDSNEDTAYLSYRLLTNIVRLTQAVTKTRLSNEISIDDAKRAINILIESLKQQEIITPEGLFDYERAEAIIPKSKRDVSYLIKEIIRDLQEKSEEKLACYTDIKDKTDLKSVDVDLLDDLLEKMKMSGDIFEARRGKYKLI